MSRFRQELDGSLGPYWQRRATEELDKVKADLRNGNITIDKDGVARNCIGRALMDDLLEKLSFVTEKVDVSATQSACDAEVKADLAAYRAAKHTPTAEELSEMRAAFGEGATIVDILSGETIKL